jgi:hypothetical protein
VKPRPLEAEARAYLTRLCPYCKGHAICQDCDGVGKLAIDGRDDTDDTPGDTELCDTCHGTGTCMDCTEGKYPPLPDPED